MRRFKLYDAITEHDLGLRITNLFYLFFFFNIIIHVFSYIYDFMTPAYELIRKHDKEI